MSIGGVGGGSPQFSRDHLDDEFDVDELDSLDDQTPRTNPTPAVAGQLPLPSGPQARVTQLNDTPQIEAELNPANPPAPGQEGVAAQRQAANKAKNIFQKIGEFLKDNATAIVYGTSSAGAITGAAMTAFGVAGVALSGTILAGVSLPVLMGVWIYLAIQADDQSQEYVKKFIKELKDRDVPYDEFIKHHPNKSIPDAIEFKDPKAIEMYSHLNQQATLKQLAELSLKPGTANDQQYKRLLEKLSEENKNKLGANVRNGVDILKAKTKQDFENLEKAEGDMAKDSFDALRKTYRDKKFDEIAMDLFKRHDD